MSEKHSQQTSSPTKERKTEETEIKLTHSLVVPWPDGKSMHQLDELGVMFSVNELRQVVRELQVRHLSLSASVMRLETEVQGLRLAVNYEPGERQAKGQK